MNQYQNPYYMVPQRRPRAWVNGTLIVLNIQMCIRDRSGGID